MAFDSHHKELFTEAVYDLKSENPLRSVLLPTVMQKTGKGRVAYIDHAGPRSDLKADLFNATKSWTSYDDKRTRDKQERLVDGDAATYDTFDEWQKTRTPHEEITKQRTLMFYRLLEWGYTFDETMDVIEFTSPRSKYLRRGVQKIQAGIDALIITALRAASVQRGFDDGTAAAVNLPASQQINSTANDKFGLADITSVMELFDGVNNTEKVYILISPKSKKILIDDDAAKINNQDFVSSYEHFATGSLPDVYGAHLICHPYINDDEFLAYTQDSVGFMHFGRDREHIDEDPGERFQAVAYMEKGADAKRLDDLGVVQGTITSA